MEEEGVMNLHVESRDIGIVEEGLINDVHNDGPRAIERVEKGVIMTFTMTT